MPTRSSTSILLYLYRYRYYSLAKNRLSVYCVDTFTLIIIQNVLIHDLSKVMDFLLGALWWKPRLICTLLYYQFYFGNLHSFLIKMYPNHAMTTLIELDELIVRFNQIQNFAGHVKINNITCLLSTFMKTTICELRI